MRIDEYQRIYEAKHDDELLLLADSSADLTDEARAALHSELGRRGLRAEVVVRPAAVTIEQNLGKVRLSDSRFTTVGEFLNGVMSTYRAHFWLFVGLVAPAIVFGYYGREFSRMFGRYLVEQFLSQHPGESIRSNVITEVSTVAAIINLLIWICFCLSYACVSSAVSRIKRGGPPLIGSTLDKIFKRPGRFLGISTVLGVSFMMLTGGCALVYWLIERNLPLVLSHATDQMVLYALGFLVMLVLSRFALAIPAVTLGGCTVRQSIFRSDEMTEGKWTVLAALLLKSIVGGYIAGMLPFWIAGWMWPYVHFYTSILTVASIVGVILVEPILFIGFSLLYEEASQTLLSDQERSVSAQLV